MSKQTNSDYVDVKKVRPVLSQTCCMVDSISIEGALQTIYKAGFDLDTYIRLAVVANDTDDDEMKFDKQDALTLLLKNAVELTSQVYGIAEDLASALGANMRAKQEENEEATS